MRATGATDVADAHDAAIVHPSNAQLIYPSTGGSIRMTAIARRRMSERARDFLELHRRIRCIDDERARDDLLQDLQHPTRPYVVSFVNAHAANLASLGPVAP
jgi:hypothetical protein